MRDTLKKALYALALMVGVPPVLGRDEYEKICALILEDAEIRFCGFIDVNADVIVSKTREGLEPMETDGNRQKIYHDLVARITRRKTFDSNLGRVKYSASRREKVVMMSFPIGDDVVMVMADPNINIDRTAYRIIEKLGSQWSEFYEK